MSASATQWDWPLLHSHCRREAERLLRNSHDAEDAAQEALARAWRKRHTCRTPGAPVAWLLQITRNEAFRVMGRRRDLPGGQEPPQTEPSTGHSLADDLATRVDVRRAISRLTEDERLVLHLRYGEDLKQNRIAKLLDTPEGTIKVRLYRARKRLKADLTDEPEGHNASQ